MNAKQPSVFEIGDVHPMQMTQALPKSYRTSGEPACRDISRERQKPRTFGPVTGSSVVLDGSRRW